MCPDKQITTVVLDNFFLPDTVKINVCWVILSNQYVIDKIFLNQRTTKLIKKKHVMLNIIWN